MLDSLGEDAHSPVPGLVHRYPDRVLFLVTDRCAAYCRYCTRSRLVSNAQDYNFHPEYEQGLRYIEAHPEVRDVLLSGGDPLLLSDKKLEHLHQPPARDQARGVHPHRLADPGLPAAADHARALRDLQEVRADLDEHPREPPEGMHRGAAATPASGCPSPACRSATRACSCKGVNDDADVMKALVHRLLRMRVRPYYLYQMDLITGGSHFKVDVRKGIEIIRALRGQHDGLRGAPVRDRRPGRRRQGPGQPRLRREHHGRRGRLPQLRGKALPLPPEEHAGTCRPTARCPQRELPIIVY